MALRDNVNIEVKSAKAVTCILLPFCFEMKRDPFLEVIRSVVWHSKMDSEYIDAMKTGMTAKTVCVKENDVIIDWNELTTKSQQLRQHQLLGYWATKNFPALGKKLFGDTWKAFQRRSVEVLNSEAMSSNAVDIFIMRKMKLRSVELTISSATMTKLKPFVKTPKSTGTYNEIRISSTIKSFDIEDDHIENCWKQLRHENPSMSAPQSDSNETDQIDTMNATATASGRKDLSGSIVRAVKRLHTSKANEVMTENGQHLIPLVKRIHFDSTTNTTDTEANIERISGSEAIHASEMQIHTNVAKEATGNSFQTLILEMRKEIENFNGRLISATQMKITDDDLRKENEMLKQHIEANKNVISSLQLGFESSNKLCHMLELTVQNQAEDSAKNLAEAEKMKTLSTKNSTLMKELYELKHFMATSQKCSNEQIEVLEKRSVEAERANVEATRKSALLNQEIDELKRYGASVETPLQQKILVLTEDLFEAERLATNVSQQKTQLEHELCELRANFASVETSLQHKIHELSEAERFTTEISEENTKLAQELYELRANVASVESSLQEKIHKLSEAERFTAEMSEKNAKLAQELCEVKQHATNIQSLYEDRIHELNKNEREGVAMCDKMKRMEAHILELQSCVASKDVEVNEARKVEENLNSLKVYTSSTAKNLQNQIAEVEEKLADTHKVNVELALENEKLQLELQRWKRDSPPMVRGEDNLAAVDRVERGEVNIVVVEQVITAGTNGSSITEQVPNESQWTDPAPDFISDDPIVRQCRPNLAKLPFGWMKFNKLKKAKFYPAFVYPTDEDGIRRAQWVIPDGYVSDTKKEYFDYHISLPEELKKPSEISALKKFNQKFRFDLA